MIRAAGNNLYLLVAQIRKLIEGAGPLLWSVPAVTTKHAIHLEKICHCIQRILAEGRGPVPASSFITRPNAQERQRQHKQPTPARRNDQLTIHPKKCFEVFFDGEHEDEATCPRSQK